MKPPSQKKLMSHNKNLLDFVQRPRQTAKKRNICEVIIDFKEITLPIGKSQTKDQASRCLNCGNPYCEWKCPLHNLIPNWLQLASQQSFQQSAELIYQTNPLPEICGRVCPQDRLCEQACTINTGFGAVTIGEIEKNVTDWALARQWRPKTLKPIKNNHKVAIIGAGPAGLACADRLARAGIKVDVYDKKPEIGGLLTFGIPGFKLDKAVMRKRRQFLQDIGVNFKLSITIGQDISFDTINSNYQSVFIATGADKSVESTIKGTHGTGVIPAINFLVGNINHTENYKMAETPYVDLSDKGVIVIGGGDTAMDCARTAIRQGAKKVTCVYRRGESDMPGSKKEVANAKREGVQFLFNRLPQEITLNSVQKVTGLAVSLSDKISEKRSTDSDSHTQLSADNIIIAFGFRPNPQTWLSNSSIKLTDNGLVKLSPQADNQYQEQALDDPSGFSQQTSKENVFAGGDMTRGADLVVTAVADGVRAASQIIESIGELTLQ